MKYCEACGVTVDAAFGRCPLCHKDLGEPEGELPYPALKTKEPKKQRLTKKVKALMTLSILGAGICVLINFVAWHGVFWSLLAVAGLLYTWLLIGTTVLSPWQFCTKVLMHLAGASSLLIAIEVITPHKIWAQDLVIPFLIIAAIILEIYYTYNNRKRWRESMVYVIIAIMIGFIPLILYAAGVVEMWWPATATAFFSVVILIGFIMFAVKQLKNELAKRFHL